MFYSLVSPDGAILTNQSNTVQLGAGLVYNLSTSLYNVLDDWVDTGIYVYWVSTAFPDVELGPAPFLYPAIGAPLPYTTFRLTSQSGVVIMDFVRSNVYLFPFAYNSSAYPVIATFPRGVLRPGGDYVTQDVCLANVPTCAWNWNGSAILQGSSYLCAAGLIGMAPCTLPPAPALQIVNTTFVARQRTAMNDYILG